LVSTGATGVELVANGVFLVIVLMVVLGLVKAIEGGDFYGNGLVKAL
jgi:hypothetical protein